MIAAAAEAKAALESLGTTIKNQVNTETTGMAQAVAARNAEVAAIKQEAAALATLSQAAERANVQTLYGGRSNMQQHLSDMAQELQYQTLLNRAEWLGFSTPQQAYSWRQTEYNQRLLMNRAEWAGYASPDQYLAYLQKERAQMSDLNTVLLDRARAYGENANAALAYYNALSGSHATFGTEGISGAQAYEAALAGLPDSVTTAAVFDDSAALTELAAYRAMLQSVPSVVDTQEVLTQARLAGGVPLHGGVTDVTIRSQVEGFQGSMEQMNALLAMAVDLSQTRATITAEFEDAQALSQMAVFEAAVERMRERVGLIPIVAGEGGPAGGGGGGPPPGAISEWGQLTEAEARAFEELAAVTEGERAAGDAADANIPRIEAEAKAWDELADAEARAYMESRFGGGGGGAGRPPAPPAGGFADEPNPEDAAAWEALSRAENDAGDSAAESAAKLKALALSADSAADASRYMYAANIAQAIAESRAGDEALSAATRLIAQAAAADKAADASKAAFAANTALAMAEHAAGDAAGTTAIKLAATTAALDTSLPGLVKTTGGWFGLTGTLNLAAGALGAVAVWHVILDAIIEALAIIIPSVVTLAAGLTAFGIAGSDAGRQVYARLVAIHTAGDALNQTLAPMTGRLEALHDAVRPQVWQLYGDAIDVVHTKTGLFNQLALQTGNVVDRLSARLTTMITGAGQGLETFLRVGGQDLAKLAQIFSNLGSALLAFIKVTQETHVDQYFLDFFVALSKVLELISRLPTPLLAAAVGLHAIYLWGGLAATVVLNLLGPLRALATAAGGLSVADSALGGLAKDASPMQRLVAAVQDVGTGFALLPGRLRGAQSATEQVGKAMGVSTATLNDFKGAISESGMTVEEFAGRTETGAGLLEKYGSGLEGAAGEAVNLAIAAGASEGVVAKLAGSTAGAAAGAGELATGAEAAAGSTGLLGGAMAALAAIPVAGWIAAAVIGAGVLTVALLRMQDATQKWIVSMDTALTKSSVYSVVGQTVSDLAAVTQKLNQAQATGVGNAGELASAQSDLSGKLQEELTHVGDISHAYGVNFVGALALLHAAGVKTSDLFTNQAKVWAAARQQVDGLVQGYKAMGVGINEAQQAVNAQLVTTSDQVKAMQSLNQAFDNFQTAVEAPVSTFLSFDQSLITFATDAQVAGAAMSGLGVTLAAIKPSPTLSNAAINLQQQFQNILTSVTGMFDALRNSEAISGGGGFIKFVKDAVQVLVPLAGHNKAAAAEVSALAQEAGGPATTNLQSLAKWAGNSKDPLDALYHASQQATIATSNLSQDAQRLSSTLQKDLNPAMAQAVFNAHGGQKVFNEFATSLARTGPDSQATRTAAHNLAVELLAVSGNSTNAKAEFVGFAESMGIGKTKADQMWASAQKGAADLAKVRDKAAEAATGVQQMGDKLGKPGTWGQFEHLMMSLGDWIGGLGGSWATKLGKGWDTWWATHGSIFTEAVHDAYENLVVGTEKDWSAFTKIFSGVSTGGIVGQFQQLWSALRSIVGTSLDLMIGEAKIAWDTLVGVLSVVLDVFAGHWGTAWADIKKTAEQDWNALKAEWIQLWNFVSGMMVGVFNSAFKPAGVAFNSQVIQPINHFFTGTIGGMLAQTGSAIAGTWSGAWNAFNRTIVAPVNRFLTATLPNWLSGDAQSFAQTWVSAWNSFSSHVLHPVNNFLTNTLPNWLGGDAKSFAQTWISAWNSFSTHVLQPAGKFFTGTVPGWLSSLGRDWSNLWSRSWSEFNSRIMQPMERWFSSSLPNAIQGGLRTGINVGVGLINKVIGFINNDVLAHLPGGLKIPTIQRVASGGGIRMASGSVPGTGDEDGTHIIAMGGEYMLRKPARMALEQAFGPNFLNSLNQADTYLGSGSRGNTASHQHGGRMSGIPAYAGGGGIGGVLGSVEGFFSGAGHDLTSGARDLEHIAGLGLGEFTKLLGKGAEEVFNAIWNATIQPMVNVAPGNTIPGGLVRAGAADVKTGIDKFLTNQDTKAQNAGLGKGGLGRAGLRQIEDWWMGAGGPGGGTAHIAAAITGAESGFNVKAVQQGQPYATTGWGLWQITPGDSEPQAGINAQLLTGPTNARAAVAKFRGAGDGFSPWTTYMDGAYRAFMAAGGPVPMAAGEVVTAIKQTTNDEQLREAMALGSWLASRWSVTSKSNQGRYGPFAIDLAKVRGVTKAEATNPARAAHYMLPLYERALKGTGAEAKKSPRTAVEAAARNAEHMVTAWAEDPSQGTLTSGWDAALGALGLTTGQGLTGPIKTPTQAEQARWKKDIAALTKAYGAEDAAEYTIYDAAHRKLKHKHPGQYKRLMADLKEIRTDQRAVRQAFHKVKPGGGGLHAADWTTLEDDAHKLATYQNAKADFVSKYTGAVPRAQKDLREFRAMIPGVEKDWAALWNHPAFPGAGSHPGPRRTLPMPGTPTIDLAPLIVGGPAVPVFDSTGGASATGSGFASGGGLDQVAAMFAAGGLVGGTPGLNLPGMDIALQRQLQAASMGQNPRTLGDAAASRVGVQVGNLTINNPVAEKPSDSITRSSNRLAFLAGRGPV